MIYTIDGRVYHCR